MANVFFFTQIKYVRRPVYPKAEPNGARKEGGREGTYPGLNFISGMGAHVKTTVRNIKGLRPQTSERAPISGALINDSMPCGPERKLHISS